MIAKIRIGTRGSKLALAQSGMVAEQIRQHHPGMEVELCPIITSGDQIQDRALANIGGKGLFTLEIERALLAGEIELAIHSLKDMPTALPSGLMLVPPPPREDPRDVFFSRFGGGIEDLPKGAVVGTASLRRQAQLLQRRPDLKIVLFRGNVDTRLAKLAAGEVDATLLAMAGLRRLGGAAAGDDILRGGMPVAIDMMLPAVGQGALALEIAEHRPEIAKLLQPLGCVETFLTTSAERAVLAALDGSCRTPIAAYAQVRDGELFCRAMVLRPDGSEIWEDQRRAAVADLAAAAALGQQLGQELAQRLPLGYQQWGSNGAAHE